MKGVKKFLLCVVLQENINFSEKEFVMKTLISILVAVLLITGSAFASDPAPGGDHTTIRDSVVGSKIEDSTILGRNARDNIINSNINSGNTNVGSIRNTNTNLNCNENNNYNKNLNTAIAMAFSCNSANAGSNSSADISIDYENIVQGQPVIPMDLMPRILAKEQQENLWNKKFRPPFRGYFTLEELKQRRDSEGGNVKVMNVQYSWGKVKSPYEKSPGLIVLENVSWDQIVSKGYRYVKTINAKADSKTTEDACILEPLVISTLYGGHVAVVKSSMNSAAKSTGVQIGGNGVNAYANGSITGGGGLGTTYALWVGDPECKVALFRKVPNADGSIPTVEEQLKEILAQYEYQQTIKQIKAAFDFGVEDEQISQLADSWLSFLADNRILN